MVTFMTNRTILAALTAAALTTTVNCAIAQTAGNIDKPQGGMEQMTPDSHATTAPTQAPAAIDAPATHLDDPMNHVDAVTPLVAAPVTIVAEIPKADAEIVNKMVEAYNAKNVDALLSFFASDFILVNSHTTIKDMGSLREALVDAFAHPSHGTISANVDYIKDIAPGLAMIGVNVTEPATPANSHEKKSYVTHLVRYENNEWKIVSKQMTTMVDASAPVAHLEEKSPNNMVTLFAAIFGLVVGYFAAKMLGRKKSDTAQ